MLCVRITDPCFLTGIYQGCLNFIYIQTKAHKIGLYFYCEQENGPHFQSLLWSLALAGTPPYTLGGNLGITTDHRVMRLITSLNNHLHYE